MRNLTPAEIDAAWIEALEPVQRLWADADAARLNGERYRKAGGSYAARADSYEQKAHELYQRANEMRNEVSAPFEAEWDRRGGWSRAYLVPDGHIHRSRTCHTLYPTTWISWLPELSGQSEEEIVEAAATHACTVCYPSAPVEALRAAELAAKRAGECPGSRSYNHTDWRRTSYTGTGRARCAECGDWVGTTTTGKLRAHKPKED